MRRGDHRPIFITINHPYSNGYTMSRKTRRVKRYGIINFAVDILMTMLTAGFWLIWIFAREMRK